MVRMLIKSKFKSGVKLIMLSCGFVLSLGTGFTASASVESIEKSLEYNAQGVFELGAFIRLKQDLNLRKAPKGKKIEILLKGDEAQVVSIKVTPSGRRYYQVYTNGLVGFIYAGSNQSYNKWVEQAWRSSAKRFLARPGDTIRVKNKNGISIRTKPGKKRISLIPYGRTVTVRSVRQGLDGKVYYKINHRSYKGYIYAGNLERRSVLTWTEVI